jgi:predicted nucleotidyltransferase
MINVGHLVAIGYDPSLASDRVQVTTGSGVEYVSRNMRLTASEITAIREETGRLDPKAEVYLYGSRVDDSARGGDVDLLVVSDTLGFRDVLRLRTRILDRIGWQQLDLLVRRRDQADEPLAAMAQETGIRL